MKCYKNNKGFSYVEMLVVLGIMGIMVGLVSLTIGTVNRNNSNRALETLETKLNEAKIAAMSKGTNRGCLLIARSGGSIYTYVGERVDPITGNPYTAEDVKRLGDKMCSSNISISVGSATLGEDVLYVQYKQSTGEVMAYTGCADPSVILTVSTSDKNKNNVSSFKLYSPTGKISRKEISAE